MIGYLSDLFLPSGMPLTVESLLSHIHVANLISHDSNELRGSASTEVQLIKFCDLVISTSCNNIFL